MALVDATLVLQARLRALIARAVGTAWTGLASYDRADLDRWLATVLPLVEAAQRQSVALTDAYLARALDRPALGLDSSELVGEAVRAGTPMETVYTRSFVTVWTALSNGVPYEDAVSKGLHRATGTAGMDVQLSHFAAYGAIQDADRSIRGYQRHADASACSFCRIVNGAYVKSASASPLHNGCGCGLVAVLREVEPTPLPPGVAIHAHGELGPVLTDPAHAFTSESDF